MDQTPSSPARRRLPRNLNPWVPCPLPGWEGLQLRFLVSVSSVDVDAAAGNIDKQAALLVGAVDGWAFWTESSEINPGTPPDADLQTRTVERPVPAPRPGDPASFGPCGIDLLQWIVGKGFQAGLAAATEKN